MTNRCRSVLDPVSLFRPSQLLLDSAAYQLKASLARPTVVSRNDDASADQEEVLVVDCDLSKIEETRQNWPFLRDRRIDAYEGLRLRFGGSL